MLGTACCFNQFLVKKRTKRELSDRFPLKTKYNRTTIFPKRNGFFMMIHLFFRFFLSKKEQKVTFQTKDQGKPYIIDRHFSQNVTIFYARHSVLFEPVFGQKKNKT